MQSNPRWRQDILHCHIPEHRLSKGRQLSVQTWSISERRTNSITRGTYCVMVVLAIWILIALSPTSWGFRSWHVIGSMPGMSTSLSQSCVFCFMNSAFLVWDSVGPHMYMKPPENAIIHWKMGGGEGSDRMISSHDSWNPFIQDIQWNIQTLELCVNLHQVLQLRVVRLPQHVPMYSYTW